MGLVVYAGRGSVLQVAVSSLLSFLFCAAHFRCWPMKAEADDRLRAATEIHLFWVIVVAFVLKVDLADERIGLRAYDLALVITGIICVPVAAVGAVANKMYRASNRVWLRQRRPLSTLSTTTANNDDHCQQGRPAFRALPRRHCNECGHGPYPSAPARGASETGRCPGYRRARL